MSGKGGLGHTYHPLYRANGFQGQGSKMASPRTPERNKDTPESKTIPLQRLLVQRRPLFERPSPKPCPLVPQLSTSSFPCSPSTSSLAILMVSVTSEKTVGLMKRPLSSMAEPPHSSLAPSFFPLSIRSRILSNCFWSICKNTTGSTAQLPSGKCLPPYVSNNLQQGRLSYPKSSGQVVIHGTNVPWIQMFLRSWGGGGDRLCAGSRGVWCIHTPDTLHAVKQIQG